MTDTRRRHLAATGLSAFCSFATATVVEAADMLDDPDPEHFFLALFLFSLFGGLGRLLFLWDAQTRWQRHAGSLMLSVFGAWLVGLYFWESLRPPVLLATAGAMSAAGGEVVERIARRMASRVSGDDE
jgi:peptidoglycan/LPS O-acetylase OafA/YrhL